METKFMDMAIEASRNSVENGGGPFGAVIVRGDNVLAVASNSVTLRNDPTAHAEVEAIRLACATEGSFSLSGCDIYTSCEPCPMCLSAIYWAGITRIYYANTRTDANDIGFSDDFIYNQISLGVDQRTIPAVAMMRDKAIKVFEMWSAKEDKTEY